MNGGKGGGTVHRHRHREAPTLCFPNRFTPINQAIAEYGVISEKDVSDLFFADTVRACCAPLVHDMYDIEREPLC